MTLVVGKLKHPARSLGPAVDIDYCYVGLYFWPRSFVSDLKLCDLEGGGRAAAGLRPKSVFFILKIVCRKRAEEVGLLS